jgi:hypothetical protein
MSDNYMLKMNFDPPAEGEVPTVAQEAPPVETAPPVEEKTEEKRRNKEVRQRREGPSPSFGGEVGIPLAEAGRRICDERGILNKELVREMLVREIARDEAQKRAHTTGGLAYTGTIKYAIVVKGPHGTQIIGIVDDPILAAEVITNHNRTKSLRWKILERVKDWKASAIRTANILPASMRESELASIETTFAARMAAVDKEAPPHTANEAFVVEVPEIEAVAAARPGEED